MEIILLILYNLQVGGCCFSELRCAYEITNDKKNWEIIMGKRLFIIVIIFILIVITIIQSDQGQIYLWLQIFLAVPIQLYR